MKDSVRVNNDMDVLGDVAISDMVCILTKRKLLPTRTIKRTCIYGFTEIQWPKF